MSRHKISYVISYHGILCHGMSYVTTIAASLDYICVCIYIYMCIYIRVYIYIYIYVYLYRFKTTMLS